MKLATVKRRTCWPVLLVTVALSVCAATSRGQSRTHSAEASPILASGDSTALHVVDRSAAERIPNDKRSYTLAVSLYAGWMPWYYAEEAGVLGRWAEGQGIEIELLEMDYISSIEAFLTGRADACLMTNVDALGLPVAAGIDTTVLVIGDYSDGNDKLLARGITSIDSLPGNEVLLVELSVSDYLLTRALETAGIPEQDVRRINTGDSRIGADFLADPGRRAVVAWNPIAAELASAPGVRVLFDSGQIPGEILDLCVVRSDTLAADPRLGRALLGAWFEVLDMVRRDDERGKTAIARMAELSGCSVADFKSQLESTHMFWTPSEAIAFAESDELPNSMRRVGQFCFSKGLFGDDARRVDDVGIAYADGSVQGQRNNVLLRFDTSFAERVK
jgi:NitT/TauT family transport system substrate-binding protein